MAETAADVIKSALQEILVQASEAPLEADEYQDGIKQLNRMMSKFAAMGIDLGYTAVSDLGDDITVPDGAIEGIVKNLALALKPQFSAPGTPTDPVLVQMAREGLTAMREIAIEAIGPTFFPHTLPIGSGNESETGFRNEHFYDQPEEEILTEQGGYISIESETETP